MQQKKTFIIYSLLIIFGIFLFIYISPDKFPQSYLYFKYFHILSIICWMAGLFYLPRLFVYHSQTKIASESAELFKIMERRLLKAIMTPAMISSWITGLWLSHYIYGLGIDHIAGWLHSKIFFVTILSAFHGFLTGQQRAFANDKRPFSEKKWRLFNEIPTLLLIVIVYCVVLKPFS